MRSAFLLLSGPSTLKLEFANRALGNAAEIKHAISLNRIRDLGITIRCAVLKVVNHLAALIETENEGVAPGCGMEKRWQANNNLS